MTWRFAWRPSPRTKVDPQVQVFQSAWIKGYHTVEDNEDEIRAAWSETKDDLAVLLAVPGVHSGALRISAHPRCDGSELIKGT